MGPYINLAQIILSILLVLVILMQSKGSGFSGALGGDVGSIYRSRRGLEKTLFQATIVLAVLFILMSLASSLFAA